MNISEEEKWSYIVALDDELLPGSVIISEWSTFLIRDADVSYVAGAYISSIITSMSAIECHLASSHYETNCSTLSRIIDDASIDDDLKIKLHELRKYRNKWTHVRKPHEDQDLIHHPEKYEEELEYYAREAIRALRMVTYYFQGT